MNIDHFEKLLCSLSQLSAYQFALLNGGDLLFSTSNGDEPVMLHKESDIKEMADRIVHHQTYQQHIVGKAHGIFGVPLSNGHKTADSLIAYGPFRSEKKDDIKTFLIEIANLMQDKWRAEKENEDISQELSQSFEDLYLYTRIAAHIKPFKFSNKILTNLFHELLETMRVDLVFTKMPNHPEYNVVARMGGCSKEKPDEIFIDRLWCRFQTVSPTEEGYYIVDNSKEHPAFHDLHSESYRFLAIRIQHGNETYGWLGMVSVNTKEIFRRSELDLLQIMTEHIAMVITNTTLYRDMERYVINVVSSMVKAIEAKDRYTRGHSERVNRYCMKIAERLQLSEQVKEQLSWASILHDVGKIGIPEDILNKPDNLSDAEYDKVRNHPDNGVEILKPIEQLAEAIPGILHHHERYDGKGYPAGIKGDEIPLISRIIAVADTFDAITSDRAYRKGREADQALSIMKQVSGKQLDPDILNIFIQIHQTDDHSQETETHGA